MKNGVCKPKVSGAPATQKSGCGKRKKQPKREAILTARHSAGAIFASLHQTQLHQGLLFSYLVACLDVLFLDKWLFFCLCHTVTLVKWSL